MAKYTLDEMGLMAKERRIDSNNLLEIMESLADYNIDNDEVRYILKEISESENIPKNYRNWIGDALENYDELKEVVADNNEDIKNIDVDDVIVEKAPIVESIATIDVPEVASQENASGEGSSTDTAPAAPTSEQEVVVVPVAAPILEEVVPETIEPPKEEQEVIVDNSFIIDDPDASVFAAGATYFNNEAKFKELIELTETKGIKIIESNVNEREPAKIALELTPESKPYLDNLLLQLYGDNKMSLNIELVKDAQSGKEMLVMNINDKLLSSTQIQKYSSEMLSTINEIISTTDKDKDYESLMSPKLRDIRDKFHADEKDITKASDVEFVTSNENGVDKYHIVADSLQEAKEVANDLGVQIKQEHGGGVFEINDKNIAHMEDTKIGKASENVNDNERVKKIDKEQGVSDLNINYNNEHYTGYEKDDSTDEIMDFLQESKEDYRAISQLKITEHGSQRVVEMRDTNGYNQTVVVTDGKNFDESVLPQIADTYSKGADVNGSRTYEEDGSVGYFAESSENNRLIINNSTEEKISSVEVTISDNQVKEQTNVNTNNMVYTKTLGTYPTKEAANTSFVTLIVFSLVMILGLAVIYIVFGG